MTFSYRFTGTLGATIEAVLISGLSLRKRVIGAVDFLDAVCCPLARSALP